MIIHVLKGGPMRKISVDGKLIEFEMHRYCGPNILNRHGEPLKHQPHRFLEAASLWAQQGEEIDEQGVCVWHPSPTPLTIREGRRNMVVGSTFYPRGN